MHIAVLWKCICHRPTSIEPALIVLIFGSFMTHTLPGVGSVPDTNGVMGYVTNVTFRNLVMNGNAACKIKTWPNTTGEISNILYENVVLNGGKGSSILVLSTYYCGCTDPQKGWCHLFTPKPLNKCVVKNICPDKKNKSPFCTVPDGSCCAEAWPNGTLLPEISIKNITFRNFTGVADIPGSMQCRKGNPCEVNLEDVNISLLTNSSDWACAFANVTTRGVIRSVFPSFSVIFNRKMPFFVHFDKK